MKKTDYSRIAETYDENKARLDIEKESLIGEILARRGAARILDLGCGTGTYIVVQDAYYGHDPRIEWQGLDSSPEMLGKAKMKFVGARYLCGSAEDPIYEKERFDLVVCNFAFHHFPEKGKVLDNVAGILGAGGFFRMKNIFPEMMGKWWLYEYFPGARGIDGERFWDGERLERELEKRGFSVEMRARWERRKSPAHEILHEALMRTTSQLSIIGDEEFRRGLERLQGEIRDGLDGVMSDLALISILAQKK